MRAKVIPAATAALLDCEERKFVRHLEVLPCRTDTPLTTCAVFTAQRVTSATLPGVFCLVALVGLLCWTAVLLWPQRADGRVRLMEAALGLQADPACADGPQPQTGRELGDCALRGESSMLDISAYAGSWIMGGLRMLP